MAGALKDAGSAVSGAVAGHAVPAALIGAGLAWLFFESGPGKRRVAAAARRIEESELLGRARERFDEVSERASDRADSLKESLVERASRVGETLSGAAESVRDGAARLSEYTQEGARTVGATLRDGATTVGEGARRGYEYSREGAAMAWQQYPLMTGLGVLAAGVAVGLLLPGTRPENDTLGPQSDAVSQRIRTAGRTLVQQGKQVVSSATEALKQEAEVEDLGGEVARKVRRIADHVQEATVSAARRVKLDPVSILSEPQPDESGISAPSGSGKNGKRARRKK